MGNQSLLSRALPCFGRHTKLLVRAAFAAISTHSSFPVDVRQAAGHKKVPESLSQHDEKLVDPTSLSGIRVGRRRDLLKRQNDLSRINCELTSCITRSQGLSAR
jgi:hypothetical protein